MLTVVRTREFVDWIEGLRDNVGRRRILQKLLRLSEGVWGDVKPVGGGLGEIRFHFGPGYRIYYVRRERDGAVVILLAGGDKNTQERDIALARSIAARELAA